MNDWLKATRDNYDNIARKYAEFEMLKVRDRAQSQRRASSYRVNIFAKKP